MMSHEITRSVGAVGNDLQNADSTDVRALFLTKYSRSGASSRYRTFQYIPKFVELGIDCTVAPLFGDGYLLQKYDKKYFSVTRTLVKCYLARLLLLFNIRKFDLLFIEKEIFPYIPPIFEKILTLLKVRYVVDYDDALFHQYDCHSNKVVRAVLGKKISSVMRYADLVIAGNSYISAYAKTSGTRRVEHVPTTVDLDRYPDVPALADPSGRPIVIGWIGSPITAKYLTQVEDALLAVIENVRLEIFLIGCGKNPFRKIEATVRPWGEDSEIDDLRNIDIGIMPLADSPWERGKCGLKLIQYMACGLPVVASPVGANKDIVCHGKTGFLASTTEQWINCLNILSESSRLRSEFGRAGRSRVEENYAMERESIHLASIIRSVAQ